MTTITLTIEELNTRIAKALRVLSRNKFTEKQLRQYIVTGKLPSDTKRTKSGYQLFLDNFRKDLSKKEKSNVGQIAKDGYAKWREMDYDAKQPFLEEAALIKTQANEDESSDEKTKKSEYECPEELQSVLQNESEEESPDNSQDDKPKKKKITKNKKAKD